MRDGYFAQELMLGGDDDTDGIAGNIFSPGGEALEGDEVAGLEVRRLRAMRSPGWMRGTRALCLLIHQKSMSPAHLSPGQAPVIGF